MAAIGATLLYVPLGASAAFVASLCGVPIGAVVTFGGLLGTVPGLLAWWLLAFAGACACTVCLFPWKEKVLEWPGKAGAGVTRGLRNAGASDSPPRRDA